MSNNRICLGHLIINSCPCIILWSGGHRKSPWSRVHVWRFEAQRSLAGCVGDGRAESAWTTTANGLDVQLRGHVRQRWDRTVHMEMTESSEQPKSNEEESSTLTALAVDGNYVLYSCSERDFNNLECSKTIELCRWWLMTGQEDFLLWRPFPVQWLSMRIFSNSWCMT